MAENIKIDLLINAAQSAKTIGETKKALKDLKSEALNLKEGSAAFIKVATAAGELQDKISDLSATTAYLGDDLRKIKGITGIGEGIAGGFAMAQGAAALFGGENKKLEESMVKLQAVMAVVQGMTAIGNVLQKESAAVLFIKNTTTRIAIALGYQEVAVTEAQTAAVVGETVATELQTTATAKATIAQRLLNLVMKANPIALLVTLIVAGVAALTLWSNASSKAAAEEKKANDEKKKSADLLKKQREEEQKNTAEVAKSATSYISLIEKLRQTNAGSKERRDLIKQINATYGATLKNISDEKSFQDQLNTSVDQYIKFKEQEYIIKKNDEKIGVATEGKLNAQKEINKVQKEFIELEKEANKQGSSYRGIMPEELQTRIDNANKKIAKMNEWQQALGMSTENVSKQMEILGFKTEEAMKNAGKATKDTTDAQKDLLKAQEDLLKAKVDLTEQEQKQLKAIEEIRISNMKDGYAKDLEIAYKAANDKKAIFEKENNEKIKAILDAQKAQVAAGKPISAEEQKKTSDDIKRLKKEQADYEIKIDEEKNIAFKKAGDEWAQNRDIGQKEWTEKKLVMYYDEELALMNNNFESKLISQEEYNKQFEALEKAKADISKYWEKVPETITKDALVGISKSLSEEGQVQKDILDKQKEEQLITTEEYNAKILDVTNKFTEEKKKISLKDRSGVIFSIPYDESLSYLENLVKLYEKKYGKIAEIVHDTNVKNAEDTKVSDQKKLDEKQAFLEEMVKLEQLAQQQIMQILNDGYALREYNVNKEYDTKIAKIDEEQLAYQNLQANRNMDEQIQYDIQQGFENQKLEAEKVRNIEIDKIKKKQFDAQKVNDMATVAINTAVAIAAAMKLPYVAPFVIPGIVASGLLQEGIIASKKYIPSFATGGLFQTNGMVTGPGTGTSDSVNAKLSNGESVINAKSTQMFGPMLSAINQAGGGKAIPHLKSGGVYVAPVQQNNGSLDTEAIVNAIYATNDRPIETYVRESSITTAQKNKQKLKNRTSF